MAMATAMPSAPDGGGGVTLGGGGEESGWAMGDPRRGSWGVTLGHQRGRGAVVALGAEGKGGDPRRGRWGGA